jgi:hypothetical protein
MSRKIRVQVRRSGLAGSHEWEWGDATYTGKDSHGEDVYRVVFGSPGHERSAMFRWCDLDFSGREEKG